MNIESLLKEDLSFKGLKLSFYKNTKSFKIHNKYDWIDPLVNIKETKIYIVVDNGFWEYRYIKSHIKDYELYDCE